VAKETILYRRAVFDNMWSDDMAFQKYFNYIHYVCEVKTLFLCEEEIGLGWFSEAAFLVVGTTIVPIPSTIVLFDTGMVQCFLLNAQT